MGDRALAHIEKIVKVYPIVGADKIEMVQLLDFHVVCKKDEFKVGDLVVYVEVDSILPDGLPEPLLQKLADTKKALKKATGEDLSEKNPIQEFEFLRSKKFRIKALRYGKFLDVSGNATVSMGIVFPTKILETVPATLGNPFSEKISVGLDVTSSLGITKVIEDVEEVSDEVSENRFEKVLDKYLKRFKLYRNLKKKLFPKISGKWQPDFPSPSDEENIQKIYSKLWEKYSDDDGWVVSEKMEGQKILGFFKSYHFGVCSRVRFLKTDDGSDFWNTAKKLDIEKKMAGIGKNLFIRGEHLGRKIQGNIYKFPEPRVMLFDVYDLDAKKLYNYYEFIKFCNSYGFEHCPIIDDNFKLLPTVQEMLAYSNGLSKHGPVLREGVVIRRKNNFHESFKVRSPEYLVGLGK